MELIKADAERRDPEHRKALVVLLDGALGLWNLAQALQALEAHDMYPDIMHVVGYLWSAANALFGEGSKDGTRWCRRSSRRFRGRSATSSATAQILTKQRLRKSVRETLEKVITFFHNHRRWMQYDVYLAAGCPLGPASWSRRAVPSSASDGGKAALEPGRV